MFDPISIIIRSFTAAVFPGVNLVLNKLFGVLYDTGISPVTKVSEPVYSFLKDHFLAFEQPRSGANARVGEHEQRPLETWIQLCWPHGVLRVHAGCRHGERSSGPVL
jgi:hypothetical protein